MPHGHGKLMRSRCVENLVGASQQKRERTGDDHTLIRQHGTKLALVMIKPALAYVSTQPGGAPVSSQTFEATRQCITKFLPKANHRYGSVNVTIRFEHFFTRHNFDVPMLR